jgi:hypothetical protein
MASTDAGELLVKVVPDLTGFAEAIAEAVSKIRIPLDDPLAKAIVDHDVAGDSIVATVGGVEYSLNLWKKYWDNGQHFLETRWEVRST